MKRMVIAGAAALLLAGCGNADSKVSALEVKLAAADARLADQDTQAQAQARELKSLRDELATLKQGHEKLVSRVANIPSGLSRADVREEIAAVLEKLGKPEADATKAPDAKPEVAGPTGESRPAEPADAQAKADEAKRKLADMMPTYLANLGDHDSRRKMNELLWETDAATRKEVVARLKALVAEDPENKNLRMALAEAMTSTFRDVKQGLEQGILASNIMKEAKKAQQIDPGYYDAVHFVAVFKANYPPGFPEFEDAKKDLDKAILMQAKMSWESRFAEIYDAYGKWYLVQKKYDEALAITQAGLDKDARAENLIELKKRIEEARK